MKFIIIFIFTLKLVQNFEIIDYSSEPYALISMDQAYLYKKNGTLFHVFNISEIEQKFHLNDLNLKEAGNEKIRIWGERCKEYLEQLTIHRNKRSINFLGSVIKFVAGTPDHDDMVLVQQKLNELAENNNRLSIVNSKLKKNLEWITGYSAERNVEIIFEWLATELAQVIHTINLAKNGILNTAALNLEEINQIIKDEAKFDAPLMEILEQATFKILQVDSVYIMLIKYPIIDKKCMLYNVKPIELEMGKLKLEEFVVNCEKQYITVRDCKKYITTNICKYSEHTCTEKLLNGIKANCTIVREHMHEIDEIDNGKLLIHGTHTVNNITKKGTFLILYNDSVLIDNQNFTNDKKLISDYLQRNRPSQYDIFDIIKSENKLLQIPDLTIIEKIPIEIETHPIKSTLLIISIIIITIILIHYAIKICKIYNAYKLRKEKQKSNAYVRTLFNKELGTISFNAAKS